MLSSVQLREGNIILRPFHFDDSQQLYLAVRESLAELKPWMSWAHAGYSLDEVNGFIKMNRAGWEASTQYGFVIIDAKNGDVLGSCGLNHLHPAYHFCNLGYWVRTSRHGEGIAGRAALLAAQYGFEHVALSALK